MSHAPSREPHRPAAQSTCDQAYLQICISECRGHAASLVSPLASRSFLSAQLKGRTSHQQDTPTNSPIRGRHHLGTRGRLILGIGGRHHFGIRGRNASEFAGNGPNPAFSPLVRTSTISSRHELPIRPPDHGSQFRSGIAAGRLIPPHRKRVYSAVWGGWDDAR
ncbi:hypothetical protein CN110_31545 [Sinorhizobium meliloti]|nr:hypothetical protein CN122_27040 [Sinorhizobium meliloti]RVN64172.1 hypothetical protein CN110_31545 [Sinorhizobium meliloti]